MVPTGGFGVTYAAGSSFLRKLGSEIQEATGSVGGCKWWQLPPMLAGMNMPGDCCSWLLPNNNDVQPWGIPKFCSNCWAYIYTYNHTLSSMAGITDRLSGQALFNYTK